nr:MAG TPA: YadA-like protein [Caudoviricetes sp.]
MDKIIGITNAPDDVIAALLSGTPISVLAHGKYVGGHIVIYEDSQQIASGDLIDGQDAGGTGTYAYSLTPIEGYSGYDDAKSYRLVIDGDEINSVKNGALTNLPLNAMYIIADFGRGMQVEQTYPDLSSVSVSQTKTVTANKYQTKKLDKSLLPDGVESGIEAANTKAATALSAAQTAQDTANEAISDANTAQTTANTAKSTADAAAPKENPVFTGTFSQNRMPNTTVGEYSHAEGLYTTASGYCSHAEGTETTASGYCSHAEGSDTTASGSYSHAEGTNTIATSSEQHVQGKFNIEDTAGKYAHIVGNGGNTAYRSNAHTLDWNGVPWYKGRPQFGGTAQDNGAQTVVGNGDKEIILASSTSGSTKKFKITVDDTGKISATEVTDA